MKFRTYDNKPISLKEISDLIVEDFEYTVWVGTDSQVNNKVKKVNYSTCIVLHKKGKGARIFISKAKENHVNSLRQRLMNEAWKSLSVSFLLQKILPANAEIVIDLDINKSKKFKSGQYYQELAGMIVGQGFKCRVKPDAWAAQTVADKFSRKG
jgi:predicted RNase H-related nuclease YkuK (DUF458 family)